MFHLLYDESEIFFKTGDTDRYFLQLFSNSDVNARR